jgi:hypothetical protein
MSLTDSGPRIEIIVSPKGIPTTKVIGLKGEACKTASEAYEKCFGEVIETEATSEAYQDPHEITIETQQGGGG